MEQKLAVSREEMASSMALGVWTEHMLLQLVARYVYDRDIATPQVQFALTEVADEVRHMIMFANAVESIGATTYSAPWKVRESGRLLKTAFPVQGLWALILLTEEIFDRIQREIAADETAQPVIRAIVPHPRGRGGAAHQLRPRRAGHLRPEPQQGRAGRAAHRPRPDHVHVRPGAVQPRDVPPGRAGPARGAQGGDAANRPTRPSSPGPPSGSSTHYREIGLIGGSSEKIWRAGGFL